MAFGSHAFDRSHSVGLSSVEGLQMKLGNHVKPTPEVFLPHHFQIVESAVLNGVEYTFEAEEAFLDWTRNIEESKKRFQASLEKQQNERCAQENHKHASRHDSDEDHGLPRKALKKPTPNAIPVLTPVQAQLGTDILIPTPSGTSNKEKNDNGTKIVTSHSSNHLFDLADFENVSDPFEAMELQTINDMEELKSVLASSSTAVPPPPIDDGNDDDDDDNDLSSSENLPAPMTVDTNHSHPSEAEACLETKREAETFLETKQEEEQPQTETEAVAFLRKSKPDNESLIKSQSVPKDSSYMSQSQVDHDDLSQSLDKFILHSTVTDRTTVLNSAPLPPIQRKPVQCTKENADSNDRVTNQRRRSDSSPLDLRPAESILNHSNDVKPPGYPNNLSKYTPLPPSPATSSASMRSKVKPEDPDFSALDEESRNFATIIISMGFPEGRTARAVKRLGHDDRLVIDALCALDRLCSQGFNETNVEEALHLLDNNDEKILAFLNLWKQFEELGFKSDDIKRELLLHNNEEEKVLDALTAKP